MSCQPSTNIIYLFSTFKYISEIINVYDLSVFKKGRLWQSPIKSLFIMSPTCYRVNATSYDILLLNCRGYLLLVFHLFLFVTIVLFYIRIYLLLRVTLQCNEFKVFLTAQYTNIEFNQQWKRFASLVSEIPTFLCSCQW